MGIGVSPTALPKTKYSSCDVYSDLLDTLYEKAIAIKKEARTRASFENRLNWEATSFSFSLPWPLSCRRCALRNPCDLPSPDAMP